MSVAAEKAAEHFGMVMTLGIPPMSNASTRQLLGWEPDHPGLIADLDPGHYFDGGYGNDVTPHLSSVKASPDV